MAPVEVKAAVRCDFEGPAGPRRPLALPLELGIT